jgi:hypothetical protein
MAQLYVVGFLSGDLIVFFDVVARVYLPAAVDYRRRWVSIIVGWIDGVRGFACPAKP